MTPVLLIGGGMIAHDQILPALFQMQRENRIGEITVCAQRASSVKALAEAPALTRAFPGQTFRPLPDFRSEPTGTKDPERYRRALADLPPRSVVVVATPDQTHYPLVMDALRADQHVVCVKPLVLDVMQSLEIESEADKRGLFVGVEYHKRFDPRSLMARARFRQGLLGELKLGHAVLMEKWYYRESNFQNWFSCEETDSFVYIGCHYVDLVHFITGLKPASVSVYGVKDKFPNGVEGYLWTDARVIWENDACLNVQNSLSFPDAAPGPNTQGMTLYFSGNGNGALLRHSDQYRGLEYTFTQKSSAPGATQHVEPSPDYFMYQDLGGPGLTPWGYGVRSVDALVSEALHIERQSSSLEDRKARIAEVQRRGILATPANSRFNELVCQAGRLSILNRGREVRIDYAAPGVSLGQSISRRRYQPSHKELTMGLDAVYYEIKQLIDMACCATNAVAINNAILESRLVHVRSLLDFFAHETREDDDILAAHYGFPLSPVGIDKQYRTRLNKDLAHITYSRLHRSEAASDSDASPAARKDWPDNDVIAPVLERCVEFIAHLLMSRESFGVRTRMDWQQMYDSLALRVESRRS